jgi:hypothetical protein
MTVDVTATFPLNAAAALGRSAAVKLAADKQGFNEATALRAEIWFSDMQPTKCYRDAKMMLVLALSLMRRKTP